MRVAYVTSIACGSGHAVRGAALVAAGHRAGIEVRAFGPPKDVTGYEGSVDWPRAVAEYRPDLLLSDYAWRMTGRVRASLSVPGWLLLRWVPAGWLDGVRGWERTIAIEPAAEAPDRIEPIIDISPLPVPPDGSELRAGYNAFWRAAWFGYRDRVRWYTDGSPERQARIDAGGEMTANGADTLLAMLA